MSTLPKHKSGGFSFLPLVCKKDSTDELKHKTKLNMRQRPVVRAFLSLLLSVTGSSTPSFDAASLLTYLRAGDDRMVRPSATLVSQTRAAEPAVASRLEAVVVQLVRRTTPHGADASALPMARSEAAEVIAILADSDPSYRATLGGAAGVVEALVELVDRCVVTAVSPFAPHHSAPSCQA